MSEDSNEISIVSFNVNGLRNPVKRHSIFQHFKKFPHDIICLQETHLVEEDISLLNTEWGSTTVWNSGTRASGGVGILVRPNANIHITDTQKDSNGRVLAITIEKYDTQLQICNIYAPDTPANRPTFFDTIPQYVTSNCPVVLLGDFNMVENPKMDRGCTQSLPQFTTGIEQLKLVTQSQNLTDIWRHKNKYKYEYTWPVKQHHTPTRIDRIYISHNLITNTIKTDICPTQWSDHKYVTVQFPLKTPTPRGINYWKLNTSILDETPYQTVFKELLQQQIPLIPRFKNILLWWDDLKFKIQTATVGYCKKRNVERRQTLQQIKQQINNITKQETPDRELLDQLYHKMYLLKEDMQKGSMIRSRETIILENEKPSKYFFSKESARQEQKNITRLKHHRLTKDDNQNTVYTKKQDILTEIKRFYTHLYKHQSGDQSATDTLINTIEKKLPQSAKEQIDSPITTQELREALFHMEKNKAPGIDGLPVEFYQMFWEDLQPYIHQLATYIYEDKQDIAITHKHAIQVLVPKSGNLEDLENWRPISLICADYKIIAKTLANRLTRQLPHIMNDQQSCSVPGREIAHNLLLIRDIIHNTYRNPNKHTYLTSIDIHKAFDTLNHDFLRQVLTKLGFGTKFLHFYTITHKERTSSFMQNGNMTEIVHLERGLRQGDPLSQIYYCLASITIANLINKSPQIHGYTLPGTPKHVKLSQWADDTISITQNPQSILRTLEKFSIFGKASGCYVKKAKLKGLIIGHEPKLPQTPTDIKWMNDEGLEILGITFFNDTLRTQNHNWMKVTSKIQNKLQNLTYRSLSLRGKVHILNAKALSLIWFTATIIPLPKWAATSIEKHTFKFLWNSKRTEPISRNTIYLPLDKGGLGLLHPTIQTWALQLKHLLSITDAKNPTSWAGSARYWVGSRLARTNPEWSFLTANNTPTYSLFERNLPPHYEAQLKHFKTHAALLTKLPKFTTKEIYKVLMKDKQDNHINTSHNSWNTTYNKTLPWQDLWKNTYQSYLPGGVDDTLYRILHHSYPVATRTHNPRQRQSTACKFCRVSNKTHQESMIHVFAKCAFACSIWIHYKHIYHKLHVIPFVYEDTILTLNHTTKHNPTKKLLLTITSLILYELWHARNEFKYENIYPNTGRTKRRIKTQLANLLKTHFRKHKKENTLDSFRDKFLIQEALGKLDQDNLILTIP